MVQPIPSLLVERYQSFTPEKLAVEVHELLRKPDREVTVAWAALKTWVIYLSVEVLRPVLDDDQAHQEAAARWVAFILRYILPLCSDERRPTTGERVLTIMQQRPNLIRLLLYGSYEQIAAALRLGENAPVTEVFADDVNVAVFVQHSAGVERTVRKWADQVGEVLERVVIRQFLDTYAGAVDLKLLSVVAPTSLEPVVTGLRATLEWYAEHVPAAHRLQARGYLHMFTAQMELARVFLRQLTRAAFFMIVIILGLLPPVVFEGNSQAAAVIAVLTGSLVVLYGLLFAYIRYVLTMGGAAIETLRTADQPPAI